MEKILSIIIGAIIVVILLAIGMWLNCQFTSNKAKKAPPTKNKCFYGVEYHFSQNSNKHHANYREFETIGEQFAFAKEKWEEPDVYKIIITRSDTGDRIIYQKA